MRRTKKKDGWSSHDVIYWSDKFKRPIAYSTKGTSDYLAIISEEYKLNTATSLLAFINSGKVIPDQDAIKVLEAYISKGVGEEVLNLTL